MAKKPNEPGATKRQRLIASAAARLIAEDGLMDYTKAKRKAARRFGLTEDVALPGDFDIEEELRSYQRIFQDDEQTERLRDLRRKASELMAILQPFNPYLAGSVLDGSASRYSEIDIQLFTDSAKDVEIFLLNKHIAYQHSEPRTNLAEAVLTIQSNETTANLVIYPKKMERVSFKTHDGRCRQHARIETVVKLLETDIRK